MSDTKDIHSNEGDIFMYLTLPTYNSFKNLKIIFIIMKNLRNRMQNCTRNEAKWHRQVRECSKLLDLNKWTHGDFNRVGIKFT